MPTLQRKEGAKVKYRERMMGYDFDKLGRTTDDN